MEANLVLAKRLNVGAWIVSILVLLLVGMMRSIKIPVPANWDFSLLPPFHATLNALTALALIAALIFIKQKKIRLHRNAMYLALTLSALFLLSYVVYHFTNPETIYGDSDGNGVLSAAELAAVGSTRTIYLIVLLSHIALAAISLPLILFTFIKAYTKQFVKHRNMARWVYPLWLYVAITGPVCYLMLMPYYR